jgi:phage tail tape-measure protein
MNHRDHINAFNAKRAPQDLADEEASHIRELLEAAQKKEREQQQVVQAIAKTIEALRGIARWGTGDMLEAAFTGFTALPAPAATGTGPKHWREILGNTVTTVAQVNEVYRRLALAHHPDLGGDASKMTELNMARDQALRELGNG